MVFDYKKEYKELYLPKAMAIVQIPPMNFITIKGKGDLNEENGEYQRCIPFLYAVAYTLKMSKNTDHRISGYFDYVVPPLEGLWWQEGIKGVDYLHKETFCFIAMIRLPDFITQEDFQWAVLQAAKKKKMDFSQVEFITYDEGTCVQSMHIGSYDDEPRTFSIMKDFCSEKGLEIKTLAHKEIYLSDFRRTEASKLKTVLRYSVAKA